LNQISLKQFIVINESGENFSKQFELLERFRILMGNFAQGVYFIKVFSTNVKEVIKIFKN